MQKVIKFIFIVLLACNVLYVFGGVLYYPLQSMDAIGIWFFKAKAFYVAHGFPNTFLHSKLYAYSHQTYPLGLPFLIFLLYEVVGGVHEKIALFFYPFIYLAILVLAYKVIRRGTTSLFAIIFTYVYSMFGPLIASGGRILAGGADIILVLIEWVILYILYKRKLSFKSYIVLTFLIMIASQIKLEGAFLSLILLFCPLKLRNKLGLFFLSLLPLAGWMVTVYLLKLSSDTYMILPGFTLAIERLFFITLGVIKELTNAHNWHFFWILFFVVLFTKHKLSQQIKHIVVPAYLTIMAMYVLVYVFASNNTYTYVLSSFDRVLLQQSAFMYIVFFEKMNVVLRNFMKQFFNLDLKHISKYLILGK